MTETAWICLGAEERALLVSALRSLRNKGRANTSAIEGMTRKLARAGRQPEITVGVHGGQVQWTLGNPFQIRVCDYDGDEDELPDVDERGQRCRIWMEPADSRNEVF